jgi:hypothetical protein
MRSFLLASALLVGSTVTLLVGCGGSSSAGGPADGGSAPGNPATDGGTASGEPAAVACAKTQCDVDHDSCIGELNHQCGECLSICSNPDAPSSCDDDCDDICDDPDGVADCDQVLQDCRGTSENAICADQPVVDAGAPARDASAPPTSSPDAGAADAATRDAAVCQAAAPGTVNQGVPGQAQGACTPAEISTIAAQVDADNATLAATIGQTSASCQACALTPVTASIWGAFIETQGIVLLDQGACVAQLDGDCGNATNYLFLCEQQACGQCTDPTAYATCAQGTLSGACADYVLDATCQGELTGSAASCFSGNGVTDVSLAENILTLQCGSM